jgi:peptidoglycan/LPS O-acetylase OafA/YrhL
MTPLVQDLPMPVTAQPVQPVAAEKTTARSGRYYRPELDVLRCLAFFMVFSSHVLPFPHADVGFSWLYAIQEGVSGGVPLFFILTSFLITELLLREQEATGKVHIGSFYMRRILRIWPLYFLALLLAILLPHAVHDFDDVGRYIAPFLLLTGNWVIVVHGWFHNPMLTPLWSTPVQEQFYLLWPLVVGRWGRRGLIWSIAFVLPLAWGLDYLIPAMHGTRSPDLWCNSFNQFQFFALGSGLALLMHHRPFKIAGWTRALLFAAAGIAFFIAGTPCHFINDFIPSTPLLTLAGYVALDLGCVCVCLAFMGANMPGWTRPFIYLGKISLGLYIFHYTILAIVGAVVKHKLHVGPYTQLAVIYLLTWLLSVAVATVSYRYYEMPFLKLKSRFTFIRSRPA